MIFGERCFDDRAIVIPSRQQVLERRLRRRIRRLDEPGKIPDLRSTQPPRDLRGPSR